jgi:hypothetical protein
MPAERLGRSSVDHQTSTTCKGHETSDSRAVNNFLIEFVELRGHAERLAGFGMRLLDRAARFPPCAPVLFLVCLG